MSRILIIAPLAALVALAGCATPVAWQRAGADRDQMVFDLQSCRGQARAEIDSHQYFARERAPADAAVADAVGRGDGTAAVNRRWAEADARRDRDRLIADCMARKGYRRGGAPAGAPA
jgi:hypothetical protein